MSITNAVAKMYERYPYPNYPLLAKPKWQEGYLASSQLSGRLLYDLTGCSPAVHEKRTRSDSVSILLAGSGEILPYIMRKWEPKHHSILSVDLSNANLKRARFRSIFKSNMGFLQADLQSYLDEQKINLKHFDHIDAYGVVHHMEHPGNVLKSFSQRIHPNGTIRMMVYNGEARRWIHDLQKAFKLLKLSRYSKVDLDIARKILRLLEFKSEKIKSRLSSMQGILSNDSRLVDTFFHSREVQFDVNHWINLIDNAGLEIISVFDRYGELDDLKNPMWVPPTSNQLTQRTADYRFENNLEVFLASKDRQPALPLQNGKGFLFTQFFKSPPRIWFSFSETKDIPSSIRRQLWKNYLNTIFKNTPKDISEINLPIPALQRLARLGAILPSQIENKELHESLTAPMCNSMDAPDSTHEENELSSSLEVLIGNILLTKNIDSQRRNNVINMRLKKACK